VFLRALEQSGSATHAARAAGVDRTTAYGARGRDAEFAAAWDAALGAARTVLAGGVAATETPLARDEIVRSSKAGRPCVMRVGPGRWSSAKEALFLASLERFANVSRAAEAAGVTTAALYARRNRWPGFAEAWEAALRRGYTDVEMLLIENARATLGDWEVTPVPAERAALSDTMSVGDALNLLRIHRAAVKGGKPQLYGPRRQEPDIETVRANIMRKVEAMARKRGLE
jgi:hypothetical protein